MNQKIDKDQQIAVQTDQHLDGSILASQFDDLKGLKELKRLQKSNALLNSLYVRIKYGQDLSPPQKTKSQQINDSEKILEGLEEKVRKYVSEAAYQTLQDHGKIDFGPVPKGYSQKRINFRPWFKKNGAECQGEVIRQDQLHGKGVTIWPDDQVLIAHRINDKLEGQVIWIFKDGSKEIGTCKKGEWDGKFIITYPDGQQQVKIWQNSVFIGNE